MEEEEYAQAEYVVMVKDIQRAPTPMTRGVLFRGLKWAFWACYDNELCYAFAWFFVSMLVSGPVKYLLPSISAYTIFMWVYYIGTMVVFAAFLAYGIISSYRHEVERRDVGDIASR